MDSSAPISLSSTGGLLLSSAWMPAAPTALASAAGGANGLPGARPGSASRGPRTVPRLVPQGGGSTGDDLDELSALLRKRAELSQARPSTAAAVGR